MCPPFITRKDSISLTKNAPQHYDVIEARRRSRNSSSAVYATKEQGMKIRKVERFIGYPAPQRPAGFSAMSQNQPDGTRTAYAFAVFRSYHGSSQRHLPFLHHISMQSVVPGDTFFVYRFVTNVHPLLSTKISDRQATQQQHRQPKAE